MVVFHVLQVALLTDEQVQILLPICMHGLHVSLPEKGGCHCWVGARGTGRGLWDSRPERAGGEGIWHLHGCGSHRGSQLLPRGGKRRERGQVTEPSRAALHRCLGCTVHKAQEGMRLPKVVLLKNVMKLNGMSAPQTQNVTSSGIGVFADVID